MTIFCIPIKNCVLADSGSLSTGKAVGGAKIRH